MRIHAREVPRLAIFIALAVASGLSLIQVPNVELMTTVVFLSGLLLGSLRGALIGSLAMAIFSVFNPVGVPVLPVLVVQIFSMALFGLIGGLSNSWVGKVGFSPSSMIKSASLGCALTIFYDLGTNFGFAATFGLISEFWAIMAAGLVFSLIHTITNGLLFAFLIPPVVRVAVKGQNGKSSMFYHSEGGDDMT